MNASTPLRAVRAWHDAVNGRRVEDVLALSDPHIEVVGPRGSGFGHDLLRAWFGHAGVQLEPLRAFVCGDAVVVEEHGTWRSGETGEVTGEAEVASYFRVRDGIVIYYARLDDLNTALRTAGLSFSDEVALQSSGGTGV